MGSSVLARVLPGRTPVVPLTPAQGAARQAEIEGFLGKVIVAYLVSSLAATVALLLWIVGLPSEPGRASLVLGTVLLLAVNTALTAAAFRGHHLFASIAIFFVGTAALVVYSHAIFADADAHLLIIGLLFAAFVLLGPDQDGVRWITGLFGLAAYLYVEFGIAPGSGMFPLDAETNAAVQSVIRVSMAAHIAIDVALMQYRFAASRRILVGIAAFAELRATTDELTGLVNRRPVIERLEHWAHEREGGYTIALVDVDHFKSINDDLGHDCGDALIQDVAAAMQRVFRRDDLVSRWGGDEFMVLMRGVSRDDAGEALERLRVEVGSAGRRWGDRDFGATVSIGAAFCVPGQSPDVVITAADKALYRAKEAGRDQVVVLGGEASTATLEERS